LDDPIAGETYSVVGFNEGIVDSDNFNVIVLNGISEDDTTNAAETVDSNLDRHDCWARG
jgi:hypothetical protein